MQWTEKFCKNRINPPIRGSIGITGCPKADACTSINPPIRGSIEGNEWGKIPRVEFLSQSPYKGFNSSISTMIDVSGGMYQSPYKGFNKYPLR